MAYAKGSFDYMPKPVKQSTLMAKVKRAMKANAMFP